MNKANSNSDESWKEKIAKFIIRILSRYWKLIIPAVLIIMVLISGIIHYLAEPGEQILLYFGLISYVKSVDKTDTSSTSRIDESQASDSVTYIGNMNSKIYHKSTCSHLPDEKNRIKFKTRQEATERNFEPCGHCNP